MKYRFLLLLLLLNGLPPAPAAASADPVAALQPAPGRGPVEALLRHRELLALTDPQTAALREIGARLEQRNRPLVTRLLEIRRSLRAEPGMPRRPAEMTPAQREVVRAHFARARPLLRRIRENNHAAMREVRRVLTPEQRERLREILQRRRVVEGPEGRARHRGR